MNVILKEILKDKSYTDCGYDLFAIAEKAVDAGDIVSLDMQDVLSVPTLFMNTSFGDLIDKYGIEKTKKLFLFKNVNKSLIEKIQSYFDKYQALLST